MDSRSGNFHALLQFRIDAGDSVLKQHLQTASKNVKYTSKTIQNDMINVCGRLIQDKILCEVKQARFFSIIADEATDVANTEQLSISIRFVDESGAPCERFLCFHACETGLTGKAIANNIIAKLVEWQLEPEFLRGQVQWLANRRVQLHALLQSILKLYTCIVHLTG